MSDKQAASLMNEKILSDLIEMEITCNRIDQNDERSNPFVDQYYKILNLYKYIKSSSNISEPSSKPYQQQNVCSNTISPVTTGGNLESDSDSPHESDEFHPHGKHSQTIPSSLDLLTPKYYNILALDGGGIRGIVQAIILMEIERRTNKRIGELFNCLAGTSTGGILACGLACNVVGTKEPWSAKELLRLYLGPQRFEIFCKRSLWPAQMIWTSKYSHKGIEKVLETKLPSQRLQDCDNHDLIIPTEVHKHGPALFINHAGSSQKTGLYFYKPDNQNNTFELRNSSNFLLKDVARCTSAAAPLFPPKTLYIEGKSYTFYDGGYRFNCPDHIALKWATTVRQIPNNNILLLSLSNSSAAPVPIPSIHNVVSCIRNTARVYEMVTYNNPGENCRTLLGKNYIRISPKIDTSIALDVTDLSNLQLLWQAAWDKIKEMDKDGSFNQLCQQLLSRSSLPSRLVEGGSLVDEVSYYPTRYMREPEKYSDLDSLFRDNYTFEERDKQLPPLLKKFLKNCQKRPDEDRLQCPIFKKYFGPRSLSLAAGIGHIPSLLHYLLKMESSIGRLLTLNQVQKTDFQLSNGICKWGWNSFHYAAANGEIIAALVLLYCKQLYSNNLMEVLEESVLVKMIKLLDNKTGGVILAGYSPAELAEHTKHPLMATELRNERSRIDWRHGQLVEQRQLRTACSVTNYRHTTSDGSPA